MTVKKAPQSFVKRSTPLEEWQTPNPILWRTPAAGVELLPAQVAVEMLDAKFGVGKSNRLQTWERSPEDRSGPHWIAVRAGTPLHVDLLYPRYTHQLVVYNDGLGVIGRARDLGEPLTAGVLFCCDTHSPHQVIRDPRVGLGMYYLAASMDAQEKLDPSYAWDRLLAFVEAAGVKA